MPIKKNPKKKELMQSDDGHTALGCDLLEAMHEVLAHSRGEIELPSYEYHVPAMIEVAPVRKRLGLSQVDFARTFGLCAGTIRDWEQGRRKPEGAARILLAVIDKYPEIVQEVLHGNLPH